MTSVCSNPPESLPTRPGSWPLCLSVSCQTKLQHPPLWLHFLCYHTTAKDHTAQTLFNNTHTLESKALQLSIF